jgi:hypothetical protein
MTRPFKGFINSAQIGFVMMEKGKIIFRFLIVLTSILVIIGALGLFFLYRISKSQAPGNELDFSRIIKEKVISNEAPVSPDAARVFFTSDGKTLSAEFSPLPLELTPYQRVERLLNRLLTGPASKYFEPTLPQNVKILGIFMEENVVTLDFSEELKTQFQGGLSQELITVYSIVNTVTLNVDGIERVQILINGKTVPLLSREIDLEKPLRANLNLIRY